MLTFIKFCILFMVCFAETLVINNVTLKMPNKVNKICWTAISVLVAMCVLASIFKMGENYIPFGQ